MTNFLSQYQTDAMRTEAPISAASTRLASPSLARINHCVLGLVSDFHELRSATTRVNEIEEVSDLFWFLNLGLSAIGETLNATAVEYPRCVLGALFAEPSYGKPTIPREVIFDHCHQHICELADATKSRIHYGKETFSIASHSADGLPQVESVDFKQTVRHHLNQITAGLSLLCLECCHVAPQTVMQLNIAKLKARYPGKFTEEAALNRDLAREHKVLSAGSTIAIVVPDYEAQATGGAPTTPNQ